MIIIDKVLKFILINDYYNKDTLGTLNDIYNNLERYNIARDLSYKLEKFLTKKEYLDINEILKIKMKGKVEEIDDVLQIMVEENTPVDITLIERLFRDYSKNRKIFKFALGLLCRYSEKYLSTALKFVEGDTDIALFGLAASRKKEAIPVILKNIEKVENDTFRECIRSIIELKQETQLLRIIKSSIDIQKKIFVLNILQSMELDNIKESMLKIAKDNIVMQPALSINALKNVKVIHSEDDFNVILNMYEQFPPIYQKIISDVIINISWSDNKLEKYMTTLLIKNFVKKSIEFIKKLGNDELRNAIVKSMRVDMALEEHNIIKRYIEKNINPNSIELLYLNYYTLIKDKDVKFFAVQLLLEGSNSRKLTGFEVGEEMLAIFIKYLTKHKYTEAAEVISYYTIDKEASTFLPSIEFFKTLKYRKNIDNVVELLVEQNIFNREIVEVIGQTRMDEGMEHIKKIMGVCNDLEIVAGCIYALRFFPPGEVYELIKDYLYSENNMLLGAALDTLIYLRVDKIRAIIENNINNENLDIKIIAMKGIIKFNLSLMDNVIDILNSFEDKALGQLFKNLHGVYSSTILEVLIYHFTQKEYSQETATIFFDYIKTYPNKELVIDKLNNVLKAI